MNYEQAWYELRVTLLREKGLGMAHKVGRAIFLMEEIERALKADGSAQPAQNKEKPPLSFGKGTRLCEQHHVVEAVCGCNQ